MVYLVYERPLVVGRAERGGNIKTTPKNPAVAVQILSSSQIRGPFEDEKTIVNKKIRSVLGSRFQIDLMLSH